MDSLDLQQVNASLERSTQLQITNFYTGYTLPMASKLHGIVLSVN